MRLNRIHYAISLLAICSASSFAETRWCLVTGKGESDKLWYPPIARAAHITGTVIERITFSSDGKVLGADAISGPRLLSQSVSAQLTKWSFKTEIKGEFLCQALIIADFAFGDTDSYYEGDMDKSMFKIAIRAKEPVLYSMPATKGNH